MAVIIKTDYKDVSSELPLLFSVEVDSIVQTLERAPGNRFIHFHAPTDEWTVWHMHDGAGNAPDGTGNGLGEAGNALLQRVAEAERRGLSLSDSEVMIKFLKAKQTARTTDVSGYPSFGEAIREAIRGLMAEYADKPASPLRAEAINEVDEWLSENAQPVGNAAWVTKDSTNDIMPSGFAMTLREMAERIKLLEEKVGAAPSNLKPLPGSQDLDM